MNPGVPRRGLVKLFWSFLFSLILSSNLFAQQPETWGEFWSEADAYFQLDQTKRLNFQGGTRSAGESSYLQWYTGTQLNLQLKPVIKEHLPHYDRDKESYFVFGVGYQYWRTTQDDKSPSNENRGLIEITPRYYPGAQLLLTDRNLIEFRFINGEYSTRYRNRLTLERAFQIHHFRFDPYGWGELYYDTRYDGWIQNQYSFGVQFQFGRRWMLDSYYLHQNTSQSTPNHLNVAGLTLNYFFQKPK
ncbi:MAG: DUF2490 domain-containing protein [Terriglobia bacterium]